MIHDVLLDILIALSSVFILFLIFISITFFVMVKDLAVILKGIRRAFESIDSGGAKVIARIAGLFKK